jgi:DNA invertase Pin-like site-specific DNA recombinase
MKRKLPPGAAIPSTVRKFRCAIYTRVSTDENLDQAYNSLHAQCDACGAYIKSQEAEGWIQNPDRYDDGGFSGGTLERPALQRLLVDITAGQVDVVVVYKVDRLSRSLMDFAKLVEIFDAQSTTFVSVTQSFNTRTSMGRLTVNMFFLFAQYEREIIGERIRDKFAASRARGMWMGGKVPLGYDVRDRKLVVNEAEARIVLQVFWGFAEIGSGTKLTSVLRTERVTTTHGKLIDKGDIYKLLNNRTYVGETAHKGNVYPGEHKAIVTRELWDPGPCHPAREPTGTGEQEPGAIAGASAGADIWSGREGPVAQQHSATRTALPLLCESVGAEGNQARRFSRYRAAGVGRGDRGGGC